MTDRQYEHTLAEETATGTGPSEAAVEAGRTPLGPPGTDPAQLADGDLADATRDSDGVLATSEEQDPAERDPDS